MADLRQALVHPLEGAIVRLSGFVSPMSPAIDKDVQGKYPVDKVEPLDLGPDAWAVGLLSQGKNGEWRFKCLEASSEDGWEVGQKYLLYAEADNGRKHLAWKEFELILGDERQKYERVLLIEGL